MICHPYVEPAAAWRRIGNLHGRPVELVVEGDTAYVRVDDYVRFCAGVRLIDDLTTLVEQHTGELVTEVGPPMVSS